MVTRASNDDEVVAVTAQAIAARSPAALGTPKPVIVVCREHVTDAELVAALREIADQIETRDRQPRSATEGLGRNDQCPCGSGKKVKRCCGA